MPFLTLNGITMPVRKGGEMTAVEAARRGRSPTNRYFLGRNGRVGRVWRFQTKPLPMDQARIIERMLMHEGDHWQFALKGDPDGVSTSASDFASDHGAVTTTANDVVASNRGADGGLVVNELGNGVAPRDSATGALGTIAGTTNLLSAANADPNTSTDLLVSGTATLSTETNRRWRGVGCVKAVAALAGDGIATATVGATGGPLAYVGTAHVKGDVGGESIQIRLVDDAIAPTTKAYTLPAPDKWARIPVAHTTDGTTTTLDLRVFAASGTPTFYVDGLQIEQRASITAWQDPAAGARAGPTLSYPTNIWQRIGRGSFTLNAWVRYDNADLVSRIIMRAAELTVTTNLQLFMTSANFMQAQIQQPDGSATHLSVSLATGLTAGAWGMVTAVYDATAPSLSLYENGALLGTDITPTGAAPDFANVDDFRIGNAGGSSVGLGHICDVSIIPQVVPATTITSWYQGGTPTLPSGFATPMLAEGDMLPADEGPVAVFGKLGKVAYQGVARDGTWESNNRVVSFTLEEAL